MSMLFIAISLFAIGGFGALLASKSSRCATCLGVSGAVAGSVVGLIPATRILLGSPSESLRMPLNFPYPGMWSFFIEIDPLSAFFLIPIFILAVLAAIYGGEYLLRGIHAAPEHGNRQTLGSSWFFYNLTIIALVMVIISRNGLLFLLAWEIMTLASFFLVVFEYEKESVRQAGWTYMVASHLGVAFLIVFFFLLGNQAGSLDFDVFSAQASVAQHSNLLFILAIIGFGVKAGFMPLHVWLPEAHPAAPSHISALMSGVIIKMGIYGIVRSLFFLGTPPMWWGWLLIAIGISSGIGGVLFALAQHDLKRLLAYHSIENIGIIALGLGVGVLGLSCNAPTLAIIGFAGGLLHVFNHALFKSLLFFGAGAVASSAGTREIDHLGGLSKRMPITAITFLIGSIAISGLPPLNGFISEFLIYFSAFSGVSKETACISSWLLALIAALALIGGLAAACFCKAFGMVFLGEPRSSHVTCTRAVGSLASETPARSLATHATRAREVGWAMRAPMILLAMACVAFGLLSPAILSVLQPVIQQVTHLHTNSILSNASQSLSVVIIVVNGFLALLAILFLLRWALLSRWPAERTGTWDCGYARPTARMQYTASSFAQPLTHLFRFFLRTRRRASSANDIFPQNMSLNTDTPDVAREFFFAPMFRGASCYLSKLRGLQHGRVQLYVLYIVLTLLVLLLWNLN